ncbi:MAG: metal-dependent hydrolase [Candidatus Marinimicrobia bacterium]|jgi:hypothetical protein|nr:metal-dependent hydrolase [Candidatus Neomarinimicrobiota bacterium]
MASGKGHIVGGVVFLWIFLTVMANYFFVPDTIEIVIYAAIIIMFSLWPDVDIKGLGQKVFYSIFFITDLILIFYFQHFKAAAYFGLIIILPILAKHRGWTHYRITAILLPLPLVLVPLFVFDGTLAEGLPYYFAAVTGYFSHLFFDKILL